MTTNRPRRSSVIFSVVVVFAAIATLAHADPGPMHIAYQQDFEAACSGWCAEAFARGDCAGIEADPFGAKALVTNHAMVGRATDPTHGHGYRIESPAFETMGIDTRMPYQVSFRYGVPEAPACWTYVVSSMHATIVLDKCDMEAGTATLVFVDELAQTKETIGTVQLGAWNDIELRVIPRIDESARVRVRINGVVQGTFVRTIPNEFDRLVFMDPPFRYTDDPQDTFVPQPSAFGTGAWDDMVLRRPAPPDETGPRVHHMDMDPQGNGGVLSFALPRDAQVHIDLFAVNGRRVRTLFDGRMMAGPQSIAWDGRDEAHAVVASGVYLVRTIIDGSPTVLRTTVVR